VGCEIRGGENVPQDPVLDGGGKLNFFGPERKGEEKPLKERGSLIKKARDRVLYF